MAGIHILMDGNNTAYRANCTTELYTKDGRRTSAIMGTLNITQGTIRHIADDLEQPVVEVIYAWDSAHSQRRVELFPEYKASRKKDHSEDKEIWFKEFYTQTNSLHENLGYFGIKSIKIPGWEGDDIIFGLSEVLREKYPEDTLVIVSTDEDFHQLVRGNTYIYSPIKQIWYKPSNYQELTGIKQEHFLTYKILKGDSSDGIPGIPGIGEKTSKKLVNTYGNLSGIFANRVDLMKSKTTARIFTKEGLTILDRNNKLINLIDYVDLTDIKADLEKTVEDTVCIDSIEVKNYLKTYQLTSILVKYHDWIRPFQDLIG